MTTTAPSTVIGPVVGAAGAGLGQLRSLARALGARLEAVAARDDVARHPVVARALRNVAGLPDRPPHELALGVVTLGIMIATDSIVVDVAANVVAVLFVNHPHPVADDPASADGAADAPDRPGAVERPMPRDSVAPHALLVDREGVEGTDPVPQALAPE